MPPTTRWQHEQEQRFPAFFALLRGDFAAVRALQGSPEASSFDGPAGISAVHAAAYWGDAEGIAALAAAGASLDVLPPPFTEDGPHAPREKELDVVHNLWRATRLPERTHLGSLLSRLYINPEGASALVVAACEGHEAAVAALLQHGAQLGASEALGSCLGWASADVINRLVDAGADCMLLTKARRWVQPLPLAPSTRSTRRPAVVAAAMQHVQQRHVEGRLRQQLSAAELSRLALCCAGDSADSAACHFLVSARSAGWKPSRQRLLEFVEAAAGGGAVRAMRSLLEERPPLGGLSQAAASRVVVRAAARGHGSTLELLVGAGAPWGSQEQHAALVQAMNNGCRAGALLVLCRGSQRLGEEVAAAAGQAQAARVGCGAMQGAVRQGWEDVAVLLLERGYRLPGELYRRVFNLEQQMQEMLGDVEHQLQLQEVVQAQQGLAALLQLVQALAQARVHHLAQQVQQQVQQQQVGGLQAQQMQQELQQAQQHQQALDEVLQPMWALMPGGGVGAAPQVQGVQQLMAGPGGLQPPLPLPLEQQDVLPDLVQLAHQKPAWTPVTHLRFPPRFNLAVHTLLLAAARGTRQDGSGRGRPHPAHLLAALPQDVLLQVIGAAAYPLSAWLRLEGE